MSKCNCYGDEMNCEIPVALPNDYINDLYDMYKKDCEKSNKEPLSKEAWIKTISA